MDPKSEILPIDIPGITVDQPRQDVTAHPPSSSPRTGNTSRNSSRANSRSSSKAGTPERPISPSSPMRGSPKHVKGTRAKFIPQNPRFINTPICQVLPCEGGKSVAECLEWKEGNSPGRRPRRDMDASSYPLSPGSTVHRDFPPPSPEHRPRPLQRFSPAKGSSHLPFATESSTVGRERISFQHQYDSRSTPTEPVRGKLHGSFVWDQTHKPSTSATPHKTTPSPFHTSP